MELGDEVTFDLIVGEVKEAGITTSAAAAVLVVDAVWRGQRQPETKVAVMAEEGPRLAAAILAASALAIRQRHEAPPTDGPALECLAAGVGQSPSNAVVRLELQTEAGTVLPVHLPRERARALLQELTAALRT